MHSVWASYGRCNVRRRRGLRRRREHRRPALKRLPPRRRGRFGKAYHEARKHLGVCFIHAGSHRSRTSRSQFMSGRETGWGQHPCAEKRIKPAANFEPAISACCPFTNLSDSTDEYFFRRTHRDLIPRLSCSPFMGVSRIRHSRSKQKPERAPDRARDRRNVFDPGFGRRAGTKFVSPPS